MFEPTTFWDKRNAMLEALVLQLCNAANMTGLLGPWYQQLETVKAARVEEVLGAVTTPADVAATRDFIANQLMPKCFEAGLALDVRNYNDQQVFNRDMQRAQQRIATFTNLDEAMGPDIQNGLFHIAAEGRNSIVAVVRDGSLVNCFVCDENGVHALTISMTHMPETFTWEDDRKFWRSELFGYRGQLVQDEVTAVINWLFSSVDFSELNAKMDQEEADALARATAAANDSGVEEVAPVVMGDNGEPAVEVFAAPLEVVADPDHVVEPVVEAAPLPTVDPVSNEEIVYVTEPVAEAVAEVVEPTVVPDAVVVTEPATDADTNQA